MISQHPPFDLIVDYAAGSLPEGVAMVVACHIEMCRMCRDRVVELEVVGGALLDTIPPIPISNRELEDVMARIDALEDAVEDAAAVAVPPVSVGGAILPAALGRFVGKALERLTWRKRGGLFEEARLPVGAGPFTVSLMRLKAGASVPRHTHRGVEYTLVLAGGFADGDRQFGPGDFSAKDGSVEHSPVVDDDGECLCLVVQDAPVKLTGTFGRLVNPFLRM